MLAAFIPARSGSKRIQGKNIKGLNGHPLIAYSIQSAQDSDIFDEIWVSSNSIETGMIANHYGATFSQRSEKASRDDSPDREWIEEILRVVKNIDHYAILRPTSPFRTGETIKQAFTEWSKKSIMKAVEPVDQHPGKMWKMHKGKMSPYIKGNNHFLPTQEIFPKNLYIQNASLEFRPINGSNHYQPFFTEGYEGFDLNTMDDWVLAEALLENGIVKLPKIERKPYGFTL